jgi:hypothetical protein
MAGDAPRRYQRLPAFKPAPWILIPPCGVWHPEKIDPLSTDDDQKLVGAAGLPPLRSGQASLARIARVNTPPLRAASCIQTHSVGSHPAMRCMASGKKSTPYPQTTIKNGRGGGTPSEAAFFFDFIGICSI